MEENNGNKEGNTYLSKEEKLNRLFLLVSIMILVLIMSWVNYIKLQNMKAVNL